MNSVEYFLPQVLSKTTRRLSYKIYDHPIEMLHSLSAPETHSLDNDSLHFNTTTKAESKLGKPTIITNSEALHSDDVWRASNEPHSSTDLSQDSSNEDQSEDAIDSPDEPLYSTSISLLPYRNQVGGHTPLLRFSRKALCKPLNVHERDFYEHIETHHPELLPFTAKYIGVINIKFKTELSGDLIPEFVFTENKHILPDWLIRKLSFHDSNEVLFNRSCPGLSKVNNELKEQIIKELLSPTCKNSEPGSSGSEKKSDSSKHVLRRRKSTPMVRPTISRKSSRDNESSSGSIQDPSVSNNHDNFTNPWSAQCYRRFRSNNAHPENINEWMLLEDLVESVKSPCILDLKMGTRQYGVNATKKKHDSQTEKCAKSTSKSLGVRMCGIQVIVLQQISVSI
ncbi:inositol polyphosphate kinase kcs1, variant 2 [Basidiobolus ranarum]|uniref:Kinase n=1 Tax=Basidiobolus ranarum TaxID=34480 RepID=A0ABR2WMI8_9FUNG